MQNDFMFDSVFSVKVWSSPRLLLPVGVLILLANSVSVLNLVLNFTNKCVWGEVGENCNLNFANRVFAFCKTASKYNSP